jgi:hypothetical protein
MKEVRMGTRNHKKVAGTHETPRLNHKATISNHAGMALWRDLFLAN